MFFEHNRIKLEINNRRKFVTFRFMWKLNIAKKPMIQGRDCKGS